MQEEERLKEEQLLQGDASCNCFSFAVIEAHFLPTGASAAVFMNTCSIRRGRVYGLASIDLNTDSIDTEVSVVSD